MSQEPSRHEPSTARTRELGHELRRVRKRAGYSGTDMARNLGWGVPKVSRLESGQRSVLPEEVAIYLARAHATPEELKELVALASEAHDHRLQFHDAGLPDRLRTLALLEARSMSITTYSPDLIPVPLQTDAYIRTVLQRYGHTAGPKLEAAVETRLSRQTAIFTRHSRPALTLYIHEDALYTTLADPTVLYEQLLHLQISSALPRCRIYLVPASTETFDSRHDFTIFRHEVDQPVLYVDALTASLFLEDDTEIAFYQEFLNHLDAAALDHHQSREWLANRTQELEQNTLSTTSKRPT
ncbi:helix-turn-helix domain-containing protein [Amycolatopsis sp. cmx-11-51]|uniref:helix-turn-helix domain-containing protein n=1 Tax=Amycolatopsis sp. cmx-11-51 TaxID=2785797 RepID=UPI0039E5B9D7